MQTMAPNMQTMAPNMHTMAPNMPPVGLVRPMQSLEIREGEEQEEITSKANRSDAGYFIKNDSV